MVAYLRNSYSPAFRLPCPFRYIKYRMLVMKMRRSAITPSRSSRSAMALTPSPLRNGDHRRGGERAGLVELHLDPIEDAHEQAGQEEEEGHEPIEHPQEGMRVRLGLIALRRRRADASAPAPRPGCAGSTASCRPAAPAGRRSSLSLAVDGRSLVKDMARRPCSGRCQPLEVEIWRKGGSPRQTPRAPVRRRSGEGSARHSFRQSRRNSTAPYRWSGAVPDAARGRWPSPPKDCRD